MATKSKKTIKALSPSMTAIEKAVCTQLKLKFDDEQVIGEEVPLEKVESKVKDINVPKMCRRMKRAGLLKYRWAEDGKRRIGLTRKGFSMLQKKLVGKN